MKVENNRLVPESELDSMIILRLLRYAAEKMGNWHNARGTHLLGIGVTWGAKVAPDGTVAAELVATPVKFDPETIFTGSWSEAITLCIEVDQITGLYPTWITAGGVTNYIASGCWIVRE